MHRFSKFVIAGLITLALPGKGLVASASATELSRPQAVRRVLPMSVRIQVLSGTEVRRAATGVVVRSEPKKGEAGGRSFIMTNAHVADPSELKAVTYRVLLEKHGRVERTLTAKLVGLGKVPDEDLALLEVDAALPSAEVASEEAVEVGDDVVVIGAPYGKSLSVSGGMVSQLEAEEGAPSSPLRFKAMKTDAAIGYGSSGGGVFSATTGRLIGIVEGYRTARVAINDRMSFDVPMPGETFVAPVTKIRNFLAAHLGNTEELTASRAAEKGGEKPTTVGTAR